MASRKKNDESSRHSSSLKRQLLFSSSSDEDEQATSSGACRGATTACRKPHAESDNVTLGTRTSEASNDQSEMYAPRCQEAPGGRSVPSTSARSRVDIAEQATAGQDGVRRDSNPFSFKAFLKNGTQQSNYHSTGARPKVYTSPTSSPGSILSKDNTVGNVYSSRNPTELPDFVQDHLVIEQCYLSHEPAQPVLPDVDNLPDFALNSVEQRQSRLRSESKKNDADVLCDDLRSFDLTDMLNKDLTHREHSGVNKNHLDLPGFEGRHVEDLPRSEYNDFPHGLPPPLGRDRIPSMKSNPSVNATARDDPLPGTEASVHKSLPDFLSDGPMHNRSADPEPVRMTESEEMRLLIDNEVLRQQLAAARRQISERTERVRSLEAELLSKKEVEHEETAHLEKAMEQVEDNLKRSTKRAVNAESTVTSLKKEIKALTTEISLLRLENSELRAGISSAGQSESNVGAGNTHRTVRRLARDLFTAASSAEVSLRQLMSGVDNLRVLASTLENMDRIEDWTKDFLPDSDEDNAAGPAV